MNITVLQKPAFGAVTLAQCWLHLKLDAEGSPPETPIDAALARNILSSTAEFEKSTRTAVIEQTLRLSVATLDADGVRLRPPVQRIGSVRYYDSANVLQTADSASYYLTDEDPPRVRFVTGTTLTLYDRPDALRVEYVAGFAPSGSPPTLQSEYLANVPSEIQDAVLLRVELMQANTSPADREALDRAIECIESGFRVHLSQE